MTFDCRSDSTDTMHVVLPLSCLAWALRLHINGQIRREREKVLNQVIGFFETLENQI
jgi:hypothetical protein